MRAGLFEKSTSIESLPLLSLGIYCLYGIHTIKHYDLYRQSACYSIYLSFYMNTSLRQRHPSIPLHLHIHPSRPFLPPPHNAGALPLTNPDTTECPSTPNLYRLPLSRVSVPLKRSMSVRANIPQTASTSQLPFLPSLHTVPGSDVQAAVVHGRRRNAQPAIYVSFLVFLSRDVPELRHRGKG